MKIYVQLIAVGLMLILSSPASAQTPGITVTCPETGPGFGVCVGLLVLMGEITKAANGENAFGDNGEVMKLLKAPINIVDANTAASSRESGEAAKAIRIVTGISLEDIKKRGLLGGENSEARKVCNAIAVVGGGKC